MLPRLKPIPIKDRVSMIFIEKCHLDVVDGAFAMIDKNGVHTQIPAGSIACIMLEPGVRISHRAVELAACVGTLLIWVGEAGVRLYASGQPGGARSDKLLYQAKLALDDTLRLKVVRKMYEMRFGQKAPERRSVQQLRGIEGARKSALQRDGETVRYFMARQKIRSERVGLFGQNQPLSQFRYGRPVRHHRGGDIGGRIRTGDRVYPYG